jgi:hypothetical protein
MRAVCPLMMLCRLLEPVKMIVCELAERRLRTIHDYLQVVD